MQITKIHYILLNLLIVAFLSPSCSNDCSAESNPLVPFKIIVEHDGSVSGCPTGNFSQLLALGSGPGYTFTTDYFDYSKTYLEMSIAGTCSQNEEFIQYEDGGRCPRSDSDCPNLTSNPEWHGGDIDVYGIDDYSFGMCVEVPRSNIHGVVTFSVNLTMRTACTGPNDDCNLCSNDSYYTISRSANLQFDHSQSSAGSCGSVLGGGQIFYIYANDFVNSATCFNSENCEP